MLWTEKMFGVKKPVIAALHLLPLPGDPSFKQGDSLKKVVEQARADLHALQDGGVDGILISNEFSNPYEKRVRPVTPASMARVTGELMGAMRVPFGVECLLDAMATIELAAAIDAMFVRGTFSGVYAGDGGLYDNDFSCVLRRKAALRLDELKMLYFINPETDRNLDTRPVADIAKSVVSKAAPDGLCVSGQPAGGFAVDDELIKSVKASVPENVAVICNTGCRVDTVARKLAISDAAIVATAFKENGDFHKFIDKSRVSEFMNAVREYRKTLN